MRSFRPEQIKDEELRAVLEAGTYAPTGMNKQDPWIVAVQNPDIIKQLVSMNSKFTEQEGNPYYVRNQRCGQTVSPTVPLYSAT